MSGRVDELRDAVERGETARALELLDELAGDVRDFSQCIVSSGSGDNARLEVYDGAGRGEWMVSVKDKIRTWVGGR